jgi:hypothetical protein
MSKVTKKIITIALVLLAGTAAIFSFMVYQVVGQGALLTEQVEALETERSQEVAYYRLQRQAEDSVLEREQLKSYFLDSNGNGIDLLNSVEEMAPEAGVSLTTESITLVTDVADDSEWIKTTFSFNADRDSVQNFIQVLETLPYVSRVTRISFQSAANNQWSASVTLQVRVLDYDS